jgi:hypothetical protein
VAKRITPTTTLPTILPCTIEDFQQELDSTVYPALEQQLAQAGFQCNVSAGTANLGDTGLVYMLTLMTGTWAIATALW